MLATTERRAWREAHAASRRDDHVCVRPSSPTTACVACKAGSRRGAAWVALACDSPYDHNSRHLSASVRAGPSRAPLQRVRQPPTTLEIAGLARDPREKVAQPLRSDREEPPVRRYPHDRLRNAEGYDFRVCDASSGVPRPLWQEIVSRDIDRSQQHVEVGVHRTPSALSALRASGSDAWSEDGDSRLVRTEIERRVDHVWIQVHIPWPYDCAGLPIDLDLLEQSRIAQRREGRGIEQRRYVHVADLAVGEHDTDRMLGPRDRRDHLGGNRRLHGY